MKKILFFTSIFLAFNLQAQNKLLSSIEQFQNDGNMQNSYGSNYEYDSNNNLTTETSYFWTGNSGWQYASKETFSYNANNKVVYDTYQSYNSFNSVLENQFQENYIYNTNNNVEEIISKDWSGSQWVNSSRTTISYTGNLLTEYIGYEWNGAQWINEGKGTFTYNSNDKISGNLEYKWVNGNWVVSNRDSYTYDSNGKQTSRLNEQFEGNSWVEDDKNEYTLDNLGNRISMTESHNYLADINRTNYNYETATPMSNFAHPFKDKTGLDYIFEETPHISKVLSSDNFTYNTTTSSFEFNRTTTYNYDTVIVLSKEDFILPNQVVKVFPNPTSDFVQISGLTKIQNYEIYNVLGAQLKKGTVNNNEDIDLQNFKNGLYFLKFNNGNTFKIKKN
ncbi:T9SS type A sorting domain-containing protein [Flavobacterium faecale]|nr:T9SS type A sorting domain-containing protein [Flavobacterium faecale]